ncbi:MAG: hypothetical protein O4749_03520 [Trichodesmium sp. St5_bin2_1]|nr:hypothetical protein [Trichodesmium sp. St5_bin2_1]MDE5110240.1 hypothetical protein [Trichodesmium sp. St7_bin2_1]
MKLSSNKNKVNGAIKAYSKAVKVNPTSTLFQKTLKDLEMYQKFPLVDRKKNEKVILFKSTVPKVSIVCFSGMRLRIGGILPFEFLRYLSSIYADKCDLRFYSNPMRDRAQKSYCFLGDKKQGIENR